MPFASDPAPLPARAVPADVRARRPERSVGCDGAAGSVGHGRLPMIGNCYERSLVGCLTTLDGLRVRVKIRPDLGILYRGECGFLNAVRNNMHQR